MHESDVNAPLDSGRTLRSDARRNRDRLLEEAVQAFSHEAFTVAVREMADARL